MEPEQIIPTRSKAKIPHTLSYPVGAKTISDALIGVPQFEELGVEFWFYNKHAKLHGTTTPYQVMRVRFSGRLRFHSASKNMDEKGYYSPRWTISVDAVPRALRHIIHGKIVAEALPSIRTWLLANFHPPEREGAHQLEFVFDELKGELACEDWSSIDWQTSRDRPH
jgi:hypothetical protein